MVHSWARLGARLERAIQVHLGHHPKKGRVIWSTRAAGGAISRTRSVLMWSVQRFVRSVRRSEDEIESERESGRAAGKVRHATGQSWSGCGGDAAAAVARPGVRGRARCPSCRISWAGFESIPGRRRRMVTAPFHAPPGSTTRRGWLQMGRRSLRSRSLRRSRASLRPAASPALRPAR